MNVKMAVKMAVDICMTGLLLFLAGYQLWGEEAHEWAGAGMFLLFILHHFLNRGWYRTLWKGKYVPARILQLVINLLLFLNMIGQMISGIMLSRYVFAFLPLSGGMSFARLLHMASAYWGFVLMSLHLGLHWNMAAGRMAKIRLFSRPSRWRRIGVRTVGTAIAAYGLFAFLRRDLPTYLFLRTQFVFLDYSEPAVRFYLDYLAMMGFFIFAAHYLSRGLKWAGSRRKNSPRKRAEL